MRTVGDGLGSTVSLTIPRTSPCSGAPRGDQRRSQADQLRVRLRRHGIDLPASAQAPGKTKSADLLEDEIMVFISCREAMCVALITAALGMPATLSAQKTVFKTGVEMVPLTVTVTDTKGKYVSGLDGNDFEVFEDGVRQDVAFFAREEVPLDVALLVDTSGSMSTDLPLVKLAATGLVGKLRTTDRAIVVDVKDSISIAQELTSDRDSIARAIRSVSASGETAVYDAVYVILRQLERERRTAEQVRRQAIVLLTDGIDTRSRVALEDVLDVARRGNVSIYVVTLKSALAQTPRSEQPGGVLQSDYALNTVTRESGGRLFAPKTARDLPGIYTAIAEELFSQYDLGYTPLRTVGNGDFRRVVVRLRPQTNALARTRTGYIASSARTAMAQ
jgi:Ca-activated chloride channel family protein